MKSPGKTALAMSCFLTLTVIAIGLLSSETRMRFAMFKVPLQQEPLRAEMVPPVSFHDIKTMFWLTSPISFNPNLPPVESFTLVPPPIGAKVRSAGLSVKFPGNATKGMAARVSMTVGNQTTLLQRDSEDPSLYSTSIDFDWSAFAREQQSRKELAESGKLIPVFEGRRLVRMDTIDFVEPSDIQNALQSRQSIQFTPRILEGTGFTIEPQKELMITDLSVVTDPARTWDSCTASGTRMGAWTFGRLVTAMTGSSGSQTEANAMVQAWLNQWLAIQNINTFPVAKRLSMQSLIINPWPKDANGNVDVSQAPFQLNAIVNRIDLGAASTPTGGELRFVFGLCTNTGDGSPFNVIIEYGVPASVASGCSGVQAWANEWHNLDSGTSNYNSALQAITDQVAKAGDDSTKPFGSALNQIRTNEQRLGGQIWELREFKLVSSNSTPTLKEGTIAQTPDSENASGDFNGATPPNPEANAGVLTDYINQNQTQITANTYTVPLIYVDPSGHFNGPFRGASVFNSVPGLVQAFWNGTPTPTQPLARVDFSLNTCNGCHSRETATNDVFQQVQNRQPGSGSPSALSGFLLGCNNGGAAVAGTCFPNFYPLTSPGQENVLDPVAGGTNTFGDLLRREVYLSTVLGESCTASQSLQSFVRHKQNFVH